jgi:pilus assembly protein Flp/PilA
VKLIQKFFQSPDGATAIEYALIASSISIAILGTVNALGVKINDVFYNKIIAAFGL